MRTDTPRNERTAEQKLRHDIDSGRTGDKIDFPDPAAVPLGTDAEAGGTTTDAGAASRARTAELSGPRTPRRPRWLSALILPGFVLLVAAALAFLFLP